MGILGWNRQQVFQAAEFLKVLSEGREMKIPSFSSKFA
jgi:hypothetical protein